MRAWCHRALSFAALCGMLGVQPLAAQGGRITFVGAITVPICAARGEAAATEAAAEGSARVLSCNANPRAPNPANESTYTLSVEHLSAQSSSGSPLLAYFVGYLASNHRDDARMLTRTYE